MSKEFEDEELQLEKLLHTMKGKAAHKEKAQVAATKKDYKRKIHAVHTSAQHKVDSARALHISHAKSSHEKLRSELRSAQGGIRKAEQTHGVQLKEMLTQAAELQLQLQQLLAKARSFDDTAVSNYAPEPNAVKLLVVKAQDKLAQDVSNNSTAAVHGLFGLKTHVMNALGVAGDLVEHYRSAGRVVAPAGGVR